MKKKITLDQLSKEAPFKVPAGYFNDLQQNILNKIEDKSEPKIIEFKPKYPVQIVNLTQKMSLR
jgi:hypothetical protein